MASLGLGGLLLANQERCSDDIEFKFFKLTQLLGWLFPGGGGAHKHFFDRDARPRTNFNYPEK